MNKGVLFKHVWRGWFVGVSVLFTPLFLLAALFAPDAPPQMMFGVFMIPIIAAFQGVFAGGLVLLGVTIWPVKTGNGNGPL